MGEVIIKKGGLKLKSILSETSKSEVKCNEFGERLSAPAWGAPLNSEDARTFWYCPNRDCMFEAPYPVDAKTHWSAERLTRAQH
jgi:hypothetical protein